MPLRQTLLSQTPELSPQIKEGMQWDPKEGFTIPYGPFTMYYFLTCQTVVSGRSVSLNFIPTRHSESMPFFSCFLNEKYIFVLFKVENVHV